MAELLAALMKKGGGSDIEYIDEDIEFEFPAVNVTKVLYVYSKQGKAPKTVFAEVTGAETTQNGNLWDIEKPNLDVIWRSTNGGASYTGFFQLVGVAPINGLNVSEIGPNYVKFIFKGAEGYAGTSIHVKILFE